MTPLDPTQRKFTLLHPIHIDLYGGIVKIISFNSPETLKKVATPIIGLRWQADDPSEPIREMHYMIDGSWHIDGQISRYDLWDADLASIKPLPRVVLGVISNVA